MKKTLRIFVGIALAVLVVNTLSAQTRTVRIAEYNIEDDTDGATTPLPGLIAPYNNSGNIGAGGVLEGLGEEIINGDPAQPIDILALEETTSNPTTVAPIVSGLNYFYNIYNYLYPVPAWYAMSPYQATQSGGDTGGNGPNAMVYNTNTLQLLASVGIATPTGSGNGMYRQCVRYEFAPAGVTPATNNEFYVYVSHYKADSGNQYALLRAGEAAIIRTNEAIDLPSTARVLYVGDYNPDDNSIEQGYQTILSNTVPNGWSAQGGGIDPLNTTGATNINWSSTTTNTQILLMLSEESYDLRYRDDMQLMTTNIYYATPGGLEYVMGTFHCFGNNATTTWGTSVASGGNSALNDLDPVKTSATGLSAPILLDDLTDASDHLPTVADYTIPLPTPVITSASVVGNNLSFNVSNGITNAVYTVFAAPSLGSGWTPVATNVPTTGNFTLILTNAVTASTAQQFYLLQPR